MRKEFDNLVMYLQKEPYSNEIALAIQSLEAKIDEVEKRIECAVRSAKEINSSISKYTTRVDKKESFVMTVNSHDSIQNGSSDIEIALDLNEDMCIKDNWYNLFCEDKEPSPIAVGSVEYDFPEEVYTIGNQDNTEIIADVYESVFNRLVSLGAIICEGDGRFPSGSNKTDYVIIDNIFTDLVKNKQIDLSKVPIKREVFMTFESSWGEITCDKDGVVLRVDGDEECRGERNYLFDIAKIDLVEYEKFLNSIDQELDHDSDDILSVGFWKKDNTYNEPDKDWRKNMFSPEDDEDEAPTMLCQDKQKNDAVKDIIAKLKEIEVDGETMEYILDQVGMKEQVLKQLFSQSTNDDIDYLHDVRNGNA
jgi:hypothetical protein